MPDFMETCHLIKVQGKFTFKLSMFENPSLPNFRLFWARHFCSVNNAISTFWWNLSMFGW